MKLKHKFPIPISRNTNVSYEFSFCSRLSASVPTPNEECRTARLRDTYTQIIKQRKESDNSGRKRKKKWQFRKKETRNDREYRIASRSEFVEVKRKEQEREGNCGWNERFATQGIRGKGIYKFSNILLNTCETEGIESNDGEEQEMNFEERWRREKKGREMHRKIVERK